MDRTPSLILGHAVLPWTEQGYLPTIHRPRRGPVDLNTPPSSVAALAAGYAVQLDSTAVC